MFWFPLTDLEATLSMGAIEIDPANTNIIYAGTGEATYSGACYYGRGILKSTDGGSTWTRITSGLPSSTYFCVLKSDQEIHLSCSRRWDIADCTEVQIRERAGLRF